MLSNNQNIFSSLGGWRTQLLWRLFGLCLIQTVILQLASLEHLTRFFNYPIGLQLILYAGVLLVAYGFSLFSLLFSLAAVIDFVVPILFFDVELQVSEEYILFLILPLMSLILVFFILLTKQNRSSITIEDDIEKSQVSLFRISAVVTMFFAALAKLNFDFFNPLVSCGPGITMELSKSWGVKFPDFILHSKPYQAVLLEALIPLFLLIYPTFGIFFTLIIIGVIIGHVGATAFTMIIIVMACAFFEDEDKNVILDGFKKNWAKLLAIILVFSFISFKSYIGYKTWLEFHIFQVLLITLIYAVIYLLFHQWNQPGAKKWCGFIPVIRGQLILVRRDSLKVLLIIFLVLSFFNGLTPYLGIKFRLGFAMLSNLRVDHVRWNHILIPPWVNVQQHDHFIKVTSVESNAEDKEKMKHLGDYFKRAMYVGLFSPMSFKSRLYYLNKKDIKVDIRFIYQREEYFYKDAAHNSNLIEWLKTTPDSKMFQEWLAAEGPQPCFH